MRFRNYCIVALGVVDGIKDIVNKLTETKLKFIEQKGVFIGTFSCTFSTTELRDIFDRESRTFFIFEVGDDNSAYKIGKENLHEDLFGHIENGGEEVLNFMTDNLMNGIKDGSTKMSGGTESFQPEEKMTLEQELSIAIEEEDYVKAAELRDIINLKKEEN